MFDYQCKVTRVVDGDTIDVNIDLGFSVWHRARVRMLGIDTPESRTRNLAEKAMGLASKARLKEMLAGKKVRIECSKEKGKFGRVLANVITVDKDGTVTNCNDQLCVEGHARPYFGGKKVPWV
jgi:micrococcal nuclease|tara:strand:+ start:170 stop:538 length:369 start_codon:yes stop_codon:yes gene_type:complete